MVFTDLRARLSHSDMQDKTDKIIKKNFYENTSFPVVMGPYL